MSENKDLLEKAEEVAEKAEANVQEAKDLAAENVEEAADHVSDTLDSLKDQAEEALGKVKEASDNIVNSVKENETVKVCSYKGSVFSVEPPLFVELEIIDTEPGFKGNTATNATKPAIVETGAKVMIPLFIDNGEKIRIDTRTEEYLSRVK